MHAQMLDTRRSSPIFQVPGNKARRVNAVPLLCLHIHKNNSNIARREQQEPEGQMLFCLGNVHTNYSIIITMASLWHHYGICCCSCYCPPRASLLERWRPGTLRISVWPPKISRLNHCSCTTRFHGWQQNWEVALYYCQHLTVIAVLLVCALSSRHWCLWAF